MAYVLAAYTEADYEFAFIGADGGSKDVTFGGVTIGGGIEHALTNTIFVGAEGTYTRFEGEELLGDLAYNEDANRGLSLTDDLSELKVMGTLKIKLH